MDFIELFEEGYGCAVLGSFIYGISVGMVRFFGKTETSGAVIAVCKYLAIILFIISLIQIVVRNNNSPKECKVALLKLFLLTAIIYLVISRVLIAFITAGIIYVIFSLIFSIVVVIIIL